METKLKEITQTKSGFEVIQKGNLIHSLNRTGQMFHFIDTSYLNEGLLYHGWVGYRTNEQIKEVLEGHFLDVQIKNKCKKMLIDTGRMTGTFSAINDWLTNTFMPKLINNGLSYNAVVFPENIFAQLAVEDWDQKVGGFHNRSFKSISEALTWLRSV